MCQTEETRRLPCLGEIEFSLILVEKSCQLTSVWRGCPSNDSFSEIKIDKNPREISDWLKNRNLLDGLLIVDRSLLRLIPIFNNYEAVQTRIFYNEVMFPIIRPAQFLEVIQNLYTKYLNSDFIAFGTDDVEQIRSHAESAYVIATDLSGAGSSFAICESARDGVAAVNAGLLQPRDFRTLISNSVAMAEVAIRDFSPNASANFYEQLDRDANDIERDGSISAVRSAPLWRENAPAWINDSWTQMREVLLSPEYDWQVWVDWYQDRLDGESINDELELAKALIPDETWEAGPAVVNAEIARLINEYAAIPSEDGTSRPPPSGPALPPRSGPHFYEPVTAGLGDMIVMFDGDLGDDRVEAELSRFARIARSRLLEIRTGRDIPIVFGNRYQFDHLGFQRVKVGSGSVRSVFLVTVTVVSAFVGITSGYVGMKEGLVAIRADAEWAIASAIELFDQSLPETPPLIVTQRKLNWRDESDVLEEILDKERQSRLQALDGDHPVN